MKLTNKKNLLFSFVLITIIILSGCGKKINTEINYDVDLDEKIDLITLFPNSGLSDNEFKNGYTAQLIEEITGYKVDYRQLSDSNADNQVTNYLSSHEPIHLMKLTEGQYESHVAKGAFVDLTKLLDKFGQDLLDIIPDSSWETVT